jgi:hypothetical protein
MKHLDFIVSMELYYGVYESYHKTKLQEWLLERFNEKELKYFERIVFENHTRQYKQTPDIEILNKILNNENKELELLHLDKIGMGNKEYLKLISNDKKAIE